MKIQKTNIAGYVKETTMNYVINTKLSEYQAYQNKKKRIMKLRGLEEEVSQLRNIVTTLKQIEIYNDLKNLVEKLKN